MRPALEVLFELKHAGELFPANLAEAQLALALGCLAVCLGGAVRAEGRLVLELRGADAAKERAALLWLVGLHRVADDGLAMRLALPVLSHGL